MTQYELIDNTEEKRFEMRIGDHKAIIEYIAAKNKVYFTHTEVPKALEGKGIGSQIVASALAEIRDRKLELAPLCPFVASYIRRHSEWKDLLAEGFNI